MYFLLLNPLKFTSKNFRQGISEHISKLLTTFQVHLPKQVNQEGSPEVIIRDDNQ